ncbi:MAG: type 4a pilus biogenesis protein PilO [Candidatus Omnitrophota bacterium]
MKPLTLDIDKRQIIILVVGVAMLFALILYWQFFYAPKAAEVSAISVKVKDLDINIKEEEAKRQALDYEKEINKIQQEVSRLQDKFPSQNELPTLFQELFNQADKFKIEIISLEPDKPSIYKTQGEEKTGLIFNKVPLKIQLRANYKPLAEFLKALYENPKFAFSFDDLKIDKIQSRETKVAKLEINLVLGAFVLSHEGAVSLEEDLQKTFDMNLRGLK